MKNSNIFSRLAVPMIFVSILCFTSVSQAQNLTQEAQAFKEEKPSVKFQIVELPNIDNVEVKKNRVQMVTIEKSDKMEVVEVKGANSNSKALPKKKTIVVRKVKSDKIDQ